MPGFGDGDEVAELLKLHDDSLRLSENGPACIGRGVQPVLSVPDVAVASPPKPAASQPAASSVGRRAGQPTGPAARRRRPRSSIGLKVLMASTGGLMVAFLVLHMIGNLKIFTGGASFDHYAHWLRTIGTPVLPYEWFLWIQRSALVLAVVAHIWSATVLTIRARQARPVRYAHRQPVQGSYAARTMRWGGVIVLLFIVWHILDLTTRTVNPVGDRDQAYAAVVQGFAPERWWVTVFYVVALVMVGFHLRHGLWSALQTLGVSNARRERVLKAAALVVSVGLTAGFLIVPLAVTFGLVG
ncbi:MAG: succinate dehydrogenase cytochrome b subunit [Hamadaea sp.]|nr:succinate dehydrogenase cytochrome b subunit [Hamadaea sp.]